VSGQSAGRAEAIRTRVEAPEIAALLMAKSTVAAERGVQLELTEDSHLAQTAIEANTMLSILGNLVDNAIDAAAAGAAPATVTVRLTTCEENDTIEVSDTGPGVPDDLGAHIFSDGFTTKSPDGRRHRGIGLALVHRLVSQAGGTITVDCSEATKFTVVLPTTERGRIEVGA
jgi:two-component system CitB family sensor kinase